MIVINEQVQYLQSGYSIHPVETPVEIKLPTRTQSNKIGRILSVRKLHLENNNFNEFKVIRNHIIIDFAAKYVKCQKLEIGILALINQMRIWKRVYLLYELARLNRMEQTREF